MGSDRHFKGWGPRALHIARGKRELTDLRKDIEGALKSIANELASDIPTAEVSATEPVDTVSTVTVKVLDSVGGDSVDGKVILSVGAFLESSLDSDLPGAVSEAIFSNVTKGTLLDGDGLAAMNIETATDGECVMNLIHSTAEKIVVACREWYGGPSLNCTVRTTIQY